MGGFKESFTKAGGTIVKELSLPFPGVEFQALLTEIASLKPDAVYTFFAGGGAVKFVKDYAAAGLKKPDISILSEEFLAEVRGMPQKNLAVELLRKLLNNILIKNTQSLQVVTNVKASTATQQFAELDVLAASNGNLRAYRLLQKQATVNGFAVPEQRSVIMNGSIAQSLPFLKKKSAG